MKRQTPDGSYRDEGPSGANLRGSTYLIHAGGDRFVQGHGRRSGGRLTGPVRHLTMAAPVR